MPTIFRICYRLLGAISGSQRLPPSCRPVGLRVCACWLPAARGVGGCLHADRKSRRTLMLCAGLACICWLQPQDTAESTVDIAHQRWWQLPYLVVQIGLVEGDQGGHVDDGVFGEAG